MTGNLFPGAKDLPTSEELTAILAENRHVRVERIISTGQRSPAEFWYDQEEHEWVIVLSGCGVLRFADGDELLTLKPGDYVNIPAHVKHRVESTSAEQPTVWLAVFYRDQPACSVRDFWPLE